MWLNQINFIQIQPSLTKDFFPAQIFKQPAWHKIFSMKARWIAFILKSKSAGTCITSLILCEVNRIFSPGSIVSILRKCCVNTLFWRLPLVCLYYVSPPSLLPFGQWHWRHGLRPPWIFRRFAFGSSYTSNTVPKPLHSYLWEMEISVPLRLCLGGSWEPLSDRHCDAVSSASYQFKVKARTATGSKFRPT